MSRIGIKPLIISTLFVLLLGCASERPEHQPNDFRVIMVMDMAGLGDKGFNDAGWAGVQRAVSELGINARYLQSNEQADYVPNLGLAAQEADAVVAMGFLMIDAVRTVAPLHPETSFIFVDGEIPGENIASFDFKAQEGAFLAGILAAMTSRTGKVGAILGMEIPPVRAYEVGFRAGILTANEREGLDVGYVSATVGDFNNPSRGKALAQGLIAQGADVVLQLAGNTGLGVIEAVREANGKVWAIGADLDQDDLAPGKVLVSILKRIDVAVFDAIDDAKNEHLESGHRWLGIADGATGLSEMRHTRGDVSERAIEMVERAREGIHEGRIEVPFKETELSEFKTPEI
jgi:basic membrane protein A